MHGNVLIKTFKIGIKMHGEISVWSFRLQKERKNNKNEEGKASLEK